MNVMAQPGLELAYFEAEVSYISHYAEETPSLSTVYELFYRQTYCINILVERC